jgi:hypothetical protein
LAGGILLDEHDGNTGHAAHMLDTERLQPVWSRNGFQSGLKLTDRRRERDVITRVHVGVPQVTRPVRRRHDGGRAA